MNPIGRSSRSTEECESPPIDLDRMIVPSHGHPLDRSMTSEDSLTNFDFTKSFHSTFMKKLKSNSSDLSLENKDPANIEDSKGFTSAETCFELADESFWSNNLVYCMDDVKSQVKQGNAILEKTVSFLQKYVKIQRSFADDLQKLAFKELSKMESSNSPDGLKSLWNSTLLLYSQFLHMSQGHIRHADQVEEKVIKLFKTAISRNNQGMKQALKAEKELEASVSCNIKRLQKKKSKCERSLHELTHVDDRSITSKLAHNLKVSKKKDLLIEAFEQCTDYENLVEQTNTHISNIDSFRTPPILDEIQAMEQYRHIMTQTGIRAFENLLHPLGGAYKKSQDDLLNAISSMTLKSDIEGFAKRCKPSTDIAARTFRYDLSKTPSDLIQLADPKQRRHLKVGNFIHASVENEMKSQKTSFPRMTAPLTFIRLFASIIELGGLKSEGIFRISPDQTKLESLIESIKENKESPITTKDPNISAGALKQWLREIEEPVIPQMYFKECVAIGNSSNAFPKDYVRVLDLIPSPHRAILYALVKMVRVISSPRNVAVTKMTLHNLAVIFSPCLLRQSSGDEISEVLENSKGSISFVLNLFRCVPIQEDLIQWDGVSFDDAPSCPAVDRSNDIDSPERSSDTSDLMTHLQQSCNESTDSPWEKYVDEASGDTYYYNRITGQSQWDLPQ